MSNPYLYWPVSGAACFWRGPNNLAKARAAVARLRKEWPNAEVERVQLLDNNARRYWRWRGGKWSIDNHYDPRPEDLERWDRGD